MLGIKQFFVNRCLHEICDYVKFYRLGSAVGGSALHLRKYQQLVVKVCVTWPESPRSIFYLFCLLRTLSLEGQKAASHLNSVENYLELGTAAPSFEVRISS